MRASSGDSGCPGLAARLILAGLVNALASGAWLPVAAQEPDRALLIDDGEPRVTVALSPAELTVGDRLTAVLTLTAPEDWLTEAPRFPDWGATWGSAEILEAGDPEPLEPRGGVAAFRQRLVLAAFRPGDVALPPREIEISGASGATRLTTPDGLVFHIAPVLPPPAEEDRGSGEGVETPELEPKPEEPPQRLSLGRSFWWAAGTASAACLVLALLLWRRTPLAAARPEPLTPLARLERDLAALPATPSPVEGHALLSKALRRYLGAQLSFRAPESTTTEVRRMLGARQVPDAVHRGAGEVLGACDLVKFARRETSPGALDQRAGIARQVGRVLERHLHPPRPEEPGERTP